MKKEPVAASARPDNRGNAKRRHSDGFRPFTATEMERLRTAHYHQEWKTETEPIAAAARPVDRGRIKRRHSNADTKTEMEAAAAAARSANGGRARLALSLLGFHLPYRGSRGYRAWRGLARSLLPRGRGGRRGKESAEDAKEWDSADGTAPILAMEDSLSEDSGTMNPAANHPDAPDLAWLRTEYDVPVPEGSNARACFIAMYDALGFGDDAEEDCAVLFQRATFS